MKIFGLSLDGELEPSRAVQKQHAQLGALYGALGGIAFALTTSSVDLILHRDLPLGFEFGFLTSYGLIVVLGLSVIGFVTCWAVETWRGLFYGAVIAAALVLVGSLMQSGEATTGMKFMVLVFILMPIAVLVLPVAWVLRWLAERHTQARSSRYCASIVALLFAIAVTFGAAGGYFMRMPDRAVRAVRFLHVLVQQTSASDGNALAKLPGFAEQAGGAYRMYEASSPDSTEGFDVRVHYDDGYTFSCTVIAYPGQDPYLSVCKAGE
ncbi:MAG: hypothetical protein IT313_02635 [Anaerolineales bacterium]|nr:hypothetical protein [Anaerolineales bacterium]